MNPIETAKFLYEKGLLFEINRKTFHPVGLSLLYDPEEGLMLYDHSENPESTIFPEETLVNGEKKLAAFMNEHGKGAIRKRIEGLGFVVQRKFN